MPSVSQVHAAYGALRDHQERIAGRPSASHNLTGGPMTARRVARAAAARRAERARQAMAALEPLLMEELETLAAEAQGYVDRRKKAA